jgi:hypothetical protein
VVLLLVVSLLALFVLLGATFSLIALHALTASKMELKVQQRGDQPETEMDLVLGQLLYDTQARTVLQYHSLLRDLYGYDANVLVDQTATTPQFREVFQGTIAPLPSVPLPLVAPTLPVLTGLSMGNQLYTFTFVLPPVPPPTPPVVIPSNMQLLTKLSDIPNYYAGRVLTFRDGPAANQSARIVSYHPIVDISGLYPGLYQQHYPISGTYVPPCGEITIEASEAIYKAVAATGSLSGSFSVNGAPFNGAGAGFEPQTANLDAVIASATGVAMAGAVPSTDLVSLLPNYASYDANTTRIFSPSYDLISNTPSPRFADQVALGGLDESWDAPDLQNMFLAMVPPRAAESYHAATPILPPIIPSFHRPELVNFWVNYIREQIFENPSLNHNLYRAPPPTGVGHLLQLQIMAYPYGPDRIRGNTDDPLVAGPGGTPLTPAELDRIYNIMHGSIFRPMPWDHPNFSGSNPLMAGSTPADLETIFNSLINSPNPQLNPAPPPFVPPVDNRLTWDVDNDNDGIPDSIWIDPGLPIITMPDGRRVKRLAAILIKDLDGSINLNAHGNLQQALYAIYNAGALGSTVTAGIASGADVPRGLGFGPAEVNFSNLFGETPRLNFVTDPPTTYEKLLRGRYVSNRLYSVPGKVITDDYTTDSASPLFYKGTNLPLAAPGLPYRREPLAAVAHNGVPTDFANLAGLAAATWAALPSYYASPPDVWGRGAVVLDYGGQPLFLGMGQPLSQTAGSYNSGEAIDSPYELCLNGAENGTDSPYTVAELELLLRYHDPSAPQLGRRLIDLAPPLRAENPGVIGASHTLRNMLSVVSSDIPVPATALPPELRAFVAANSNSGKVPGAASILDLYYAKLAAAGLSGTALTKEIKLIAPWEFFKGQKFDLNRPFGDGIDNDTSGARDDGLEFASEFAWVPTDADRDDSQAELPANFYTVPPRYRNSLLPSSSDQNQYARQLYARHLFCLAMLFVPDEAPRLFKPDFSTFDSNLPNAATPSGTKLHQTPVGRWLIRRIAQWAINCVDFRDQDSIMSPFEFDFNPWDGWGVDGDISAISGDNINPERGLVWGMEAPDLLITETLAFHDRRVKDTDQAGPGDTKRDDMTTPDPELDQYRIPQGSLFIELYCPRSKLWTGQYKNEKPLPPGMFFNSSDQLVLGATTPVGGSPIWRLAMTTLDVNGGTQPDLLPAAAMRHPETALTDPSNLKYMPPPGTPISSMIDRYAYFTNSVPPSDTGISFYNSSSSSTAIDRGGYAVIGPRAVTYLGSRDRANPMLAPAAPTPRWGGTSNQRIDLTSYEVRDTSGNITSRTPGTDMQPPLAIVCDFPGAPHPGAIPPAGWAAPAQWGIGLNVTEPLPNGGPSYYPEPPIIPTRPHADFYGDPDGTSNTFRPEPVEQPGDSTPLGKQPVSMLQTGTYENCSTVLLQRLADPTRPFDATLNPYITVDWSPLDVTVFNGEEDNTRRFGTPPVPIDPYDPDPNNSASATKLSFSSRQRGYLPVATPVNRTSRLWPTPLVRNSTAFTGLSAPSASNTTGAYFSVDLSNTKSSLSTFDTAADRHTLFSLNSTLDYPLSGSEFRGEPASTPFSWVNWNNRPFSNALELLSVPSSAPSRAYLEMTPGFPSPTTPAPTNPYYDSNPLNDDRIFHASFGHLMNFFETAKTTPVAEVGKSPHFYRLLDFVEVPSPFAGTERWYNPQSFQGPPPPPPPPFTSPPPPPDHYWAPFNKLSRFRNPGLFNVNTIFDSVIWDAAVAQFPNLRGTAFFNNELGQSRRGEPYSVGATNWYDKAPYLPTRFGNPFRSADSADLMPNVATGAFKMRPDYAVNATVLRPKSTIATEPLFQMKWNTAPTDNYHDTDRNPYFRYQGYQKLGNILTTRSNCFAVWITIGYFEVEENRPTGGAMVFDAAHPDGYRLGQEVGIDTGEVTRHRGFYMIDRSIPVGFMPGSRLNTDDCVLVRRLIE